MHPRALWAGGDFNHRSPVSVKDLLRLSQIRL